MRDIFWRIVNNMLGQYITVLMVLGAVTGITYIILITDIRSQEGNARIVKMSTEQALMIDDINLALTQKTYITDNKELSKINGRILSNTIQLKQDYISLSQGDRFIKEGERIVHVSGKLSPELQSLYFYQTPSVESLMHDYMASVRELQRLPASELTLQNDDLRKLLFVTSPRLLDMLNRVSLLHQRQSEFMLGSTVNKQHLMFSISVITLILVGSLLLQPLVLRLKESILKTKEEKDFADNVVNTTQALIIGLNPLGEIVLFNHYAEENSGWSEEEVRGRDFFEQFIPAQDQLALRELFTEMMAGEVEYADDIETKMLISTSDLLDIVWSPTVIKAGKPATPVMFLATGLDITERKEAEIKVQKANAELAKLTSRLQS